MFKYIVQPYSKESGLFSIHFMAEIRLYSQWQIISFFHIFVPKFQIPKIQKYVVKQNFIRGIKPRENALLMGI